MKINENHTNTEIKKKKPITSKVKSVASFPKIGLHFSGKILRINKIEKKYIYRSISLSICIPTYSKEGGGGSGDGAEEYWPD